MSELNPATSNLGDMDANISARIHQATEMTPIETVPQFAQYVIRWHANKMALLEHYLSIPAGTEIAVVDAPGNPETKVVLDGDKHLAFKAGILAALNEFAQLPFAPLPPVEAPEEPSDQGKPADVS